MHIALHCNADTFLGVGDLAFGLSVAHYLKEKNIRVSLLVRETETACRYLACRSWGLQIKVEWLPGKLSFSEELAYVQSWGRKSGPDVLFVIRFDHDISEYRQIAPAIGAALAAVDFSGRPLQGFSLVVNWEPGAEPTPGLSAPRELLGPKYAPIRPEIRFAEQWAKPIDDEVSSLLITMGGTDLAGMTGFCIRHAADAIPHCKLNVVLGPGVKSDPVLRQVGDSVRSHIAFFSNVQSMGRHFAESDIVVTAGGLSLFETLSLGRPCVCLPVVPHQLSRCEAFDAAEAAIIVSPYNDGAKLKDALTRLLPAAVRREYARNAKGMVGGRGLELIGNALIRLAETGQGRL